MLTAVLTREEVMEIRILRRQGKSIRSIAKELSISRWTVRKYLRSPGLEPDYGPRAARASKLDPFRAYSRDNFKRNRAAALSEWRRLGVA